jgi:serine/threonine-protein kinase RsbW
MAVREGVANAIKHGNKMDIRKRVLATFDLSLDGELEVVITDEGKGFDPTQVDDPLNPANLMKTSGRGIFYMRTFMDAINYSFAPNGGTQLVMTKNLGRTGMANQVKA